VSYTPHDRSLAQGDREDHQHDREEHYDDRRLAAARRRQAIGFAWTRFLVGIVVATLLAVLIAGYQSRDNAIAACVRNGDSKIIDAQFYESAAKKNKAVAANSENAAVQDANLSAAVEYQFDAVRKRATIPMPHGWHGDPRTRGNSRSVRNAGCQDAFPPPIPFVE